MTREDQVDGLASWQPEPTTMNAGLRIFDLEEQTLDGVPQDELLVLGVSLPDTDFRELILSDREIKGLRGVIGSYLLGLGYKPNEVSGRQVAALLLAVHRLSTSSWYEQAVLRLMILKMVWDDEVGSDLSSEDQEACARRVRNANLNRKDLAGKTYEEALKTLISEDLKSEYS